MSVTLSGTPHKGVLVMMVMAVVVEAVVMGEVMVTMVCKEW